jgi:hypothetical protein
LIACSPDTLIRTLEQACTMEVTRTIYNRGWTF